MSSFLYYDTEFIETTNGIDLISIGMVTETGREMYAVSSEFNQQAARTHPFVSKHVWPHLPRTSEGELDTGHPDVMSRSDIARLLSRFVSRVTDPVLCAYYKAHDHHVGISGLFGGMGNFPGHMPQWTFDLQQEAWRLGFPRLPEQQENEHHALADAHWHREIHHSLRAYAATLHQHGAGA